MWIIFSLLSSIFAALMAVFIKVGLKDVNPILSMSLRTFIVSCFCLISIFINKSYKLIFSLNSKSLLWLALASIFTFLTWLFYYLAINKGEVHKVMAIDRLSIVLTLILSFVILHEKLTIYSILGAILMVIGAVLIALL